MKASKIWYGCKKIRQCVDIEQQDLIEKLEIFRNMYGGRSRVAVRNGEYFLRKSAVTQFIKTFNLVSLCDVPVQDSNWLPISKLVQIFKIKAPDLHAQMHVLKDDDSMCAKNGMRLIQFRKTAHGRYVSLCLFNSYAAKQRLAKKLGIQIKNNGPYTMQYEWTDETNFSDDEIDTAILHLMKKNYKFITEEQCADALLSELPKTSEQILMKKLENVY